MGRLWFLPTVEIKGGASTALFGEIIRFTHDGTEHRRVLRQIAHDEKNTYIMNIDPDYDANQIPPPLHISQR